MKNKSFGNIITITIFVFTQASLFASNKDSLAIQELTEKVTILESKVDILNDANDKLISISWSVIGIIAGLFAVIIGLNFWSSFKLNSQKINNIKDELKSYLEIDLFNKHKDKTDANIKSLISAEISNLKRANKVIEHEIREIHIQFLKKELDEYTGVYGYYKIEKLISLLKLNIEVENYYNIMGNSVGVHDTLKLILDFVKSTTFDADDKKRLVEVLEKLDNRYKFHIDEIVKNIKM